MQKQFFETLNSRYFIIALFVVAIIVVARFAFVLDMQQKGRANETLIISTEEIGSYLAVLDTERFTEKDKEPIRSFIVSELKKYNYKIIEQRFGQFVNIIAYRGELDENHILVGAHYDSLQGTRGMDDNASGVSALLAMARHNKNPHIRFVAFDAEELGLLGSKYYVQNIESQPALVVSLETIGFYTEDDNTQKTPLGFSVVYRGLFNRLKGDNFKGNFSTAVCSRSAKDFCDTYEASASGLNLQVYTIFISSLPVIKDVFMDLFRSDHAPFHSNGIPSVMITDTANFRNPHYHSPLDTVETISPLFIAKQASAVLSALYQ